MERTLTASLGSTDESLAHGREPHSTQLIMLLNMLPSFTFPVVVS